jgi:hypothetical protein
MLVLGKRPPTVFLSYDTLDTKLLHCAKTINTMRYSYCDPLKSVSKQRQTDYQLKSLSNSSV